MKSQELRIGNTALFGDDKTEGRLACIDDENEVTYRYPEHGVGLCGIDEVEPVPLTKKWWKRFGFKKTDKETYFQNTLWVYNEIYIHVNDVDGQVRMNESVPIESVHHFQNLYYELTREELAPNQSENINQKQKV